jgi:malate/lactate dehydrogenase
MQHVAVLGAGELGGAIAHEVARRDVARAITLVDESGSVAAGKALDIAHAAPIEGFATTVVGTTDVSAVAGAAVIVIADRVAGREWRGDDGFALLTRVKQFAPRSVVLCAGASQRELVERGVLELKIHRQQLFGSASEGLTGGVRALVALALDGSPNDVALSVLGIPPSHTLVAWEDATAAGFALTRLLDEPARRRLAARVAALWPPGPHALAAAATKAIRSMAGRSRESVSCFVAPDTTSGTRTRTAALPVRLGPTGIVDVMMPSLSVVEKVALENAMAL